MRGSHAHLYRPNRFTHSKPCVTVLFVGLHFRTITHSKFDTKESSASLVVGRLFLWPLKGVSLQRSEAYA